MLSLDGTQWQEFERFALKQFEQRTFDHLTQYFPRRCAMVGRAAMGAAIRLGVDKARSYDLVSERCVRSYIEFMCVLGSGFDTDPTWSWAAQILSDPTTGGNAIERCDRLYARVWDVVHRSAADADAWENVAAHPLLPGLLRQLRSESIDRLSPSALQEAARQSHAVLWNLFPAGCDAVGANTIQNHLDRSISRAIDLRMPSRKGVIQVALLMFVLGDAFERDPMLPWLTAAVADDGAPGQVPVEDRLFDAVIVQLKRFAGMPSQEKEG